MGTKSRSLRVAVAAAGSVALLAAPVIAATGPGSLDSGFGDKGFTSTQIDSTGSGANGVVVGEDGSIVAAGVGLHGMGEDADSDFALVGYTSTGELDGGFGEKGSTIFDFGETYVWEIPNDLALTADGKVLVVGSTSDSEDGYKAAAGIARLEADGSFDDTLAGDGTLIANPEGLEEATAALPLPDDDFYVVGPAAHAVAVARFNADGSLDPAFAADGVATSELGEGAQVGHAVLTENGEIVVLVRAAELDAGEFGLIRIGPDGVADASFGDGGLAHAAGKGVTELAQASNGDLVAAGGTTVARFDAAGQLDDSFAGDGGFEFSRASGFSAFGLALGAKGAIVLSGAAKRGHNKRFAVSMLKGNGKLDRRFGKRSFALVKRGTAALGVTVEDDGKIVAVGRTPGRSLFIGNVGGRDTAVAIARFLGP